MTIAYHQTCAVLSGICTVEEADGLLAWLIKHPKHEVDLSGAEHLHTAVVQALMALAPRLIGQPADDFVARYLLPQLGRSGPA